MSIMPVSSSAPRTLAAAWLHARAKASSARGGQLTAVTLAFHELEAFALAREGGPAEHGQADRVGPRDGHQGPRDLRGGTRKAGEGVGWGGGAWWRWGKGWGLDDLSPGNDSCEMRGNDLLVQPSISIIIVIIISHYH